LVQHFVGRIPADAEPGDEFLIVVDEEDNEATFAFKPSGRYSWGPETDLEYRSSER
jgi:hypothetical protein